MNRITMEDVAKKAGVSSATVSRVVNNYQHVKPAVRQRVQEAIKELGYHPDPIARSLAGQRSGMIGLVIPLALEGLFEDPFFPRLMQGIASSCNNHDYILSLFILGSLAQYYATAVRPHPTSPSGIVICRDDIALGWRQVPLDTVDISF